MKRKDTCSEILIQLLKEPEHLESTVIFL